MTSTIAFSPSLPLWQLYALAGCGALILCLSAWRSPASAVFRVVAALAMLGLLLDPHRQAAERTPLDDIALILVDKSMSQTLDDRDATSEAAADQLRKSLEDLDDLSVRRIDIQGVDETRLGQSVRSALGDAPRGRLASVFLITDGRSTDEISENVLPGEAPLHVLLSGRPNEQDRKITLINAPRYGVVKESVDISFRIDDLGPDDAPLSDALPAGSAQALVALRVDGKTILEQPVPVGAEIAFSAPLEKPGATVIELSAAPRNGEISIRNNTAVLPISVIRDRLRVLLISGEPHAGERVWRNLLKSDPAIDLVHFTILRPQEKGASDGVVDQRELALIEFPQDELFIEKLDEFDLLIFDRYTYRGVLSPYHFDSIAQYVESGGAVLVASGPEFNSYLSLAERRNFSYILPVSPFGSAAEGSYRPRVSDIGARHPVTAELPEKSYWGRWLRIMPSTRKAGQILMEDDADRPLLVVDRVGEGRVGVLLSDHVWLWARGFDGGGPHAELLRRIAHWLMKEPDLEEERLLVEESEGGVRIRRRTIADVAAPVSLTTPSGSVRAVDLTQIEPGRFEAVVSSTERGLYRAESGELFAVGAVGLAAPPEFDDVVMARSAVQDAVEASRGGVFILRDDSGRVVPPTLRRIRATGSARSGARWAGVARRDSSRIDACPFRSLIPAWAWLSLIGAAVVAAWLMDSRPGGGRKRAGASSSAPSRTPPPTLSQAASA